MVHGHIIVLNALNGIVVFFYMCEVWFLKQRWSVVLHVAEWYAGMVHGQWLLLKINTFCNTNYVVYKVTLCKPCESFEDNLTMYW